MKIAIFALGVVILVGVGLSAFLPLFPGPAALIIQGALFSAVVMWLDKLTWRERREAEGSRDYRWRLYLGELWRRPWFLR